MASLVDWTCHHHVDFGRGLEGIDIPERTEILMVHSGLGTLD